MKRKSKIIKTYIHYLLPYDAQQILKYAYAQAQTQKGFDRTKTIQDAINRVKSKYPQYFVNEEEQH